jgi:hypothetical protein
MSEQEWDAYMAQLAQSTEASSAHCVSCWYEQHQEAFPALDSSSLCDSHAEATRNAYYGSRGEVQA